MKILLRNEFHNTTVAVVPKMGILSAHQVKNAKKKLCGQNDCLCSGYLGIRGEHDHIISIQFFQDGSALIAAYPKQTSEG